jgi:hypothetical protein
MELHVGGVTAEPWGRGRTLIDRDTNGIWHLPEARPYPIA